MLDAKIVNWMMKGSINVNEIYRELEYDLLKSVFFKKYKFVLECLHNYYSRHKIPPSYSVLKSLMENEGYDSSVVDFVEASNCNANEIGYNTDQIKERYNKFLMESLSEKASDIEEEDEPIEDFNDELKRTLSKIDRLYRSDVFSEGDITKSVKDRLSDYEYTSENPDQIRGFLSGYRELDDYTWGVKNSEMLVIGGASSSGKSLLMMNFAVNAWIGSNNPVAGITNRKDGKNILFISLEMSKKQLEQRVDANIASIRHRGLARGQLGDEEKQKWLKSLAFQDNYDKKFYILDMPRGTTMGEIESKYEAIMGEFKPDAIFVDYLQLMKPTVKSSGTDWLDVGKVSEELHEFCRKKNIPVVTAAQRKAAQKKTNGKKMDDVSLEDLGRSKMIGDNAAIVLIIGNREDERLREDMELHIVKNRDGAKGKISLRKVFANSKIEEFPDDWVSDPGDENEI